MGNTYTDGIIDPMGKKDFRRVRNHKYWGQCGVFSEVDGSNFFLIVRNDKNPYVKSLMRTLEIKWSHGEIYLVNQFGGTCEYGSFSSFENHFLIQRMEDIDEVKKIIDQLKEFKDGRE